MKKIGSIFMVGVLLISSGVALATKSTTLEYKDCSAKAELDCDFNLSWFGDDEGEAETMEKTDTDYSVAARIERWDSKTEMGDYKYDGDKSWAQVKYTWSDVYCYQSRHSIDDKNHTKEYVVKSYKDVD
ncbi:MAG: hypothetical protein N4A40_09440 [Tissierellales bacterium]|nr:hypothetical protein [Tissierellales bacterium]